MHETAFRTYVAEHPRTTGALFALLLLLTQAGTALGAGASVHCGP